MEVVKKMLKCAKK